ncbi:MAG: hypothetical protein M3N10_04000 [Actinomycetota bacterium]|nr:hypothetical protein [Actinomycetota bacterium]
MSSKKLWPVLLLVLLLTSCGESQRNAAETSPPTTEAHAASETTGQPRSTPVSRPETAGETAGETTAPTTGEQREDTARSEGRTEPRYGYTYGQASGNRVVEGTGGLPGSEPVDVRLDGVPTWVVGVPLGDDTAWVVTLGDGRVQAFRLDESGEHSPVSITPDELPPGQPPLVKSEGGGLELVTAQTMEASDLTHPVPVSLDSNEALISTTRTGQILMESSGRDAAVSEYAGIKALPDARFVRGAGGTLAFLSDPTERYAHGVLGDAVEADSITLLRPGGEALEAGVLPPVSGGVFEQISPLWFEAPGVEGELLAVTESTPELATRVSVYSLDGSLVAAGPFIGEPLKWRHLLAAGPFGPNGEVELVDTLTPHIGGTVEFYRPDFDSGSLDVVATQRGYTSHRIYTRNLDTVRAGDLDGDSRWELLVPNDAYTELGAIRHEANGASVAWTLPADGTIVTNLASATNSGGRAQVAAGREDGSLRIWP